jgi:hypothetical protein
MLKAGLVSPSRTHLPFTVQARFATFAPRGASHESAVDGKLKKVQ